MAYTLSPWGINLKTEQELMLKATLCFLTVLDTEIYI